MDPLDYIVKVRVRRQDLAHAPSSLLLDTAAPVTEVRVSLSAVRASRPNSRRCISRSERLLATPSPAHRSTRQNADLVAAIRSLLI
jgi:hypothetical protein